MDSARKPSHDHHLPHRHDGRRRLPGHLLYLRRLVPLMDLEELEYIALVVRFAGAAFVLTLALGLFVVALV